MHGTTFEPGLWGMSRPRPRLPRSARQIRSLSGVNVEQAAQLVPQWGAAESLITGEGHPRIGRGR
jgi:hypothetical protein